MIQGRLTPLAQRYGLPSISQLVDRLRAADPTLMTEFVEAMVTNETSFFRDVHPFETLRKSVLPRLIELRQKQRELKIWCAASSSGQEPYSIALILRHYFPEIANWRIQLTATDISHEMLRRAAAGRYSQVEVNRGLPTPLLLRWFSVKWTLPGSLTKAWPAW